MKRLLRFIWFVVLMRILTLLILGVNVRNRDGLYRYKQFILVANHNSHLDTMVLMNLFPYQKIQSIRPVAAMDYFRKNRFLRWFALNIIQIVSLPREIHSVQTDPLAECANALEEGHSLIFYPEGTRGQPEKLQNFKSGLAHLAKRFPQIPVIPVFLHGLGKALPKGEFILIPFYCDILVGEAFYWTGSRDHFMAALNEKMHKLALHGHFTAWD